MEQYAVRKDIKKCQRIYPHPHHWIFCGNKFQSCSKQGGPVTTYSEVKPSIYRLAHIPNNRLLVDDNRSVLHLLDLDEGKVIASRKLTKKRVNISRYAVSYDGETAFCVWCWGKNWYLCKFDLSNLDYCIYSYRPTLYCVRDIVFNAENQLLVLETQSVCTNGERISQNLISSVSIQGDFCNVVPVCRWDGQCVGLYCDGEYVLESNFSIREVNTQKTFSLLENSDILLPPKYAALSHVYYPEYHYLQVVNTTHNIFIDCEKRKIIARYSNDPQKLIFSGICTGDAFWIGKPDGIYAMPFPIIEE